ncbi:4-(cytidine 5'-diphospho)-2-C-methyl-D-erythritol kinase [Terricaulis silvestris]|uniref:4-diphosphocytidyl-2-C-methyl-D-erythritol kinase n=1 Tax=Terricaulis silvestris TaxID=2686094 RepID=A0A6I6MX86_9CAUL|nr:4-(cytidine 5'-diphospho)-2-C-methyl-D-erythritol kinase [Terricaulis silvestris]QGZ95803.1 4-diphosphocytidyl-2-C-methyl-D-erythritol kinase [Terricaulis silvestris]
MSVRVFAPAKVNLTLQVARPRADGLHPLHSIVMFADVGDVVEATPADALSLTITGEFADGLEAGEGNLVLRAARALAVAANVTTGAALTLEKNLPIASGIGGGSSDAAATLRALNQLWSLNWSTAQLTLIARTLGADVPACLVGVPCVMSGTGEITAPITAPSFAAVLVNPLKPLPTPDVYRQFDAMGLGRALDEREPDLSISAIAAIGNDLTPAAEALAPEIREILATLRADARVRYAALSGSGATVFALCDDNAATEAIADALQQKRPGWWIAGTILGGA